MHSHKKEEANKSMMRWGLSKSFDRSHRTPGCDLPESNAAMFLDNVDKGDIPEPKVTLDTK